MKKIIVMAMALFIAGIAGAKTETVWGTNIIIYTYSDAPIFINYIDSDDVNPDWYIGAFGGIAYLNDSSGNDYGEEGTYGLKIGKYFNDGHCALELELSTMDISRIDSWDDTFIDSETYVIPSPQPQKPGKGKGHGYGWYRKHPVSPPTEITVYSTNTVTDSKSVDINLTPLVANAVYTITDKHNPVKPYIYAGCGPAFIHINDDGNHMDRIGITGQAGFGIDAKVYKSIYVGVNAGYARTFIDSYDDFYGVRGTAGISLLY